MSSGPRHASISSPRVIPRSPQAGDDSESQSRAVSTARLASPVPSHGMSSIPQIPTPPAEFRSGSQTPLAGAFPGSPGRGPGRSALAAALEGNYGRSPPRHGTPHNRILSPGSTPQVTARDLDGPTTEGSRDRRESDAFSTQEDADIISRHLVHNSGEASKRDESTVSRGRTPMVDANPEDDEFSSLQLQGGDITRGIYKWTAQAQKEASMTRHKSFSLPRAEPEAASLRLPGAMRREFLRRGQSPAASAVDSHLDTEPGTPMPPRTSNFLQFLTLYGHFGGEELEEIEELDEDAIEDEDQHGHSERTPLIRRPTMPRRGTSRPGRSGATQTFSGALSMLLKSFVGTGVLFLPRAFANGGMLFSVLVLLGVAGLSYFCFLLLIGAYTTRPASFGDLGEIFYGKWLRLLILWSLVLSQVGFVSAYIVFTAENLKAFAYAVSNCTSNVDIALLISAQLLVFLPMSLFRDIDKLGKTALVADGFIAVGLLYLAGFDISVLVKQGGVAPSLVLFNSNTWSLFIGTAVFTFEGIGLILPIQESMKRPQDFPRVLFIVMVITAVLFTGMGALSYAAFGAETKTVVLLNLPQDNRFVNAVQFLYATAILLSTPLQLFPAVRILEQMVFTRSGRSNRKVKWEKNFLRFFVVILCALISWVGAGDLDKFVSLVGSFACIPLVYIYPPMLHYRAVGGSLLRRGLDVVIFVFGIAVMGYTSSLTISSWVGSSGGSSGGGGIDTTPDFCKA